MDINGIARSAVTQNSTQSTGDAVGVTVAKKAMDIQADAAAQLISSVPKPASEPNKGNSIDTYA